MRVEEFDDIQDYTEEELSAAFEGVEDAEPIEISQHLLFSYLVANPTLWLRCDPIMKPDYFDAEYRRVLEFVRKFQDKYKKMPSRLMIRAETEISLDGPEDADDANVGDYITGKMEEFCRGRVTEEFIIRASEIILTDKSRETLLSLQKEMEEISSISITRDLGYEIHTNATVLLEKGKQSDGIKTGNELLDVCLGGGVTCPSLNIVSAASGDGKSIWLQNMAINYAEQGYNVIFYTLELDPAMIMKRFAAMMTNTDIAKVYHSIDSIDTQLKIRGKKEGSIWLKKFPMRGTSMADIKAHYNDLTLQTGKSWQIVCIDYIDIMNPVQGGISAENIHMKDKYVSEEMNDFAHDETCPKIVWSASQQVKNADESKDPKQGHVAGGVGKINTCDNLIILRRSAEDRQDERIWGYIEKGRSSGAKGMKFPTNWNAETQRQTTGDRELFEEANPFLTGRTSRGTGRVANDAIAKEAGATEKPVKIVPSGQERQGSEVRSRLMEKLKKNQK